MKQTKMGITNLKNIDLPNYDIIPDIINRISNDLKIKLENYFIEGLKRKGFEFNSQNELESFIKDRCRCADDTGLKERVYYVDNVPFFLHNYKSDPLQMPSDGFDEYRITSNLGSYSYI